MNSVVVVVGAVAMLVAVAVVVLVRRRRREAKPAVVVMFATTRGRAKSLAQRAAKRLSKHRRVVVMDAKDADPWEALFHKEVRDLVLVMSTAEGGAAPATARRAMADLDEHSTDFRVGAAALRGHRFAVLGLGSSAYVEFCLAAKAADKSLRKLGAARVACEYLDDSSHDEDEKFEKWLSKTTAALSRESPVVVVPERKKPKKRVPPSESKDVEDTAVMVTRRQASSLTKEGYKLIGTHSAVKMCRWTKHQLRGRGGCYKHTFYGITSYQCMEATPSLACANKCVFCWRHHTNPVGREWKWHTDDPIEIVDKAVQLHVGMIKEAKGVPGVIAERWRAAHTVRHCALSLVGEPIMYPRINELIGELHARRISTFLVTNAQFPEAIAALRPVTQLYVSVDAANEDALKKIDRPLFSDAWDRLRRSLEILRAKKQRTVARLTLVKGYNESDVDGYAELISLGAVTLVEIKGVTFCGKSDASDLTMESCPWFREVLEFARRLLDALNEKTIKYELACAHEHSVSVLLARPDQLKRGDRWHTWIDYDAFLDTPDGAIGDYLAPTPQWALLGADERGFDPADTRLYKQKANGKSR